MMAKARYKAPLLSMLLTGIVDVSPAQDCEVCGLTLNSRELSMGWLFVALAGEHHHGIEFIDQAIDAGAVAILCERVDDLPDDWNCPVPVLVIDELAQQLGRVASRFYGHPSRAMKVVGVTGTNGKTTCAQLLAQVLSDRRPCGIIGTLGYGLYGEQRNGGHTTPNAIEVHRLLADMRDAGAKHVVMEVSSHGLEQGRVVGVAIDVAVFTNLSRDHLDYHGDMKNYGNAKRRLFTMKGVKHAVINMDDAFGRALLHDLNGHMQLSAYSLELTHGLPSFPLISGSDVSLRRDGMQLLVRDPKGSVTIRTPLLGRFNAANLLAVYGALIWLELPRNLIAARLARVSAVAGRMECFSEPGTPLVVVDYAHTPDALEQVLESLSI